MKLDRDVLVSGSGKNFFDVQDGDGLDTIINAKAIDRIEGDAILHSNDSSLAARDLSESSPLVGDITELALPKAPSKLAAGVASSTQVPLHWLDNSSAYTDIRVDISTNGKSWSEAAQLSASATNAVIPGLKSNTEYYFSIRATSPAGAAISAAITVTTPPAAALGLRVLSSSTTSAVLTWKEVPGATGYIVQASIDGGLSWHKQEDVGAGHAYEDTLTLDPNKNYLFRVLTLGAGGTGDPSGSVAVSTVPPPPPTLLAPNSLVATNVPGATPEVSLKWVETNPPGIETGVNVRISTDDKTFTHLKTLDSGTTSFNVTSGLTFGQQVWFDVRDYYEDAAGNDTFSPATNAASAIPTPPPPPTLLAPNSLVATNVPGATPEVSLKWVETNPPGIETGVNVRISTDDKTFTHLKTLDPGTTSFNVTSGLTFGQQVWFDVRDYYEDAAGNDTFSPATNAASAIPTPPPPPTLLAPNSLVATNVPGATPEVSLKWVETNPPGIETGVNVRISTDDKTFTHLKTLDSGTTSFNVTSGLTFGQQVWFDVRDYYEDAAGNDTFSPATNAASATPRR